MIRKIKFVSTQIKNLQKSVDRSKNPCFCSDLIFGQEIQFSYTVSRVGTYISDFLKHLHKATMLSSRENSKTNVPESETIESRKRNIIY